ncbi:MAG: NUDIX domain-containing protein [Gammaproteobacteria bacterium]|nr:NUDIX domain-containing protein [Gammaproteobacteria bacterium]NNJ50734.1 NUDIX domain-containing protein [Gammaproteobacteria bacterium]
MTEHSNARPVIGVGVLVWRNKQLLLGERIDKKQVNCWQFPGGHLEDNESVIACARREVMEETGIKVKNLRHLGYTDDQFEVAQKKYITLLVSCEYDSGEVKVLEPEKCARWQWFDYRSLPSPLFVPISHYLAQITAVSQSVKVAGDLYALHCSSRVLTVAPSGERR